MQDFANIPFGKLTKWRITHLDVCNGHLYVQLHETSLFSRYIRLYQAIAGLGNSGHLDRMKDIPKVSQLLLARCVSDATKSAKSSTVTWQRVQVMSVDSSSQCVDAYFIDDGRVENILFEDLYCLSAQFADVHPHVYQCVLDGIDTGAQSELWSATLLNVLKKQVVNRVLNGEAVRLQRNLLVLKLFLDENATLSIRNDLRMEMTSALETSRTIQTFNQDTSILPKTLSDLSDKPSVDHQQLELSYRQIQQQRKETQEQKQQEQQQQQQQQQQPQQQREIVHTPNELDSDYTNCNRTSYQGKELRINNTKLVDSIPSSRAYARLQFDEGQDLDLIICHCEGVAQFFCQTLNSVATRKLEMLEKQMHERYKTLGDCWAQPNRTWQRNDPCCVKTEGLPWCRGSVLNQVSPVCYDVFLIDYGYIQTVSCKNIREPIPNTFALPAMAFECRLSNVCPLPGEEEFSRLSGLVFKREIKDNEGQPFRGHVVRNVDDVVEVVLYNKHDVSVNSNLVESGVLACLDSTVEVTPHCDNAVRDSADTRCSEKKQLCPNNLTNYKELCLQIGCQDKCYVTYTYAPNNFFVSFSNRTSDLEALMTKIANEGKENSLEPLAKLEIGCLCLALYSEDECYYRGLVIAVHGNEGEILFVDYGNKEFQTLEHLRKIPEKFLALEKQAVQCSLNNIAPIEAVYSARACEKFEKLVLEKELTLKIIDVADYLCMVDLIEENPSNVVPRINIANSLILANLVAAKDPSVRKVSYGRRITSSTVQYGRLEINVNTYVDVSPVHVVTPHQFYCHVVQNATEFARLTEEINSYYRKSSVNYDIQWRKSMPCVALFEEDECWYRGTISSCITSEFFEVMFVDFGNSALLPSSKLRPIYQELMVLPAQAFECCIADVKPKAERWTEDTVTCFTNFVRDQHLTAFIKASEKEVLFSVMLYDTSSNPELNIGEWLIDMHDAISIQVPASLHTCESQVKPNKKEKVHVCVVKNPGNFWVQLCRYWPKLDGLMDELHQYYSTLKDNDLNINDPIIGQFCCAFSQEYEGWYRALIEEVHGVSIHVRYIDYGNTETVTRTDIKVLSSDFFSLPSLAIPCYLSDVHAYPSWAESVNQLLLDQTFEACFTDLNTPSGVTLQTEDGERLAEKLETLQCAVESTVVER